MKTTYFLLFTAIACMVQVTVLNYLKIFDVKPDLFLVSVFTAAFYLEWKYALAVSIICGFLKDVFSVSVPGVYTIILPLWCYFLLRISKKISMERALFFSIGAGIVSLINGFITRFVLAGLGSFVPWALSLRMIVLEALYTAFSAACLFILIKPLLFMKESVKEHSREEEL